MMNSKFNWLVGSRSPISKEGLGFKTCFCSRMLLWGKWLWRYVHERETLRRVVIATRGVGGVLVRFMSCIKWGYRKISRRLGRSFWSY